ncbi:ABC transporter substrate-binding protein [Burkholderia plantarii]|uniref:ABC transporter substrate-binding protein n=1 Tax=Burkholderia plantarii TaxID=41899 RepID=UPI0018DD8801|nr:ABC transporter substrate-binding protein [Burkholderia plantarii]MBI0329456.1 ABC transporter substrate-binding protein [Burkholderia plantarii]
MTRRRQFLAQLGTWTLTAAAWRDGFAAAPPSASPSPDTPPAFDFSPAQRGRIRAPDDPAARAALAASGYRPVTPGALTVAVSPFAPPIATYASDARTLVGSDPDYAHLLADALGLTLAPVVVAWPDWPLGLASGKFDAVISNVGVTEQRKRKFDFSTYRLGLHAFYVPSASPIAAIRGPRDVAGLRVITSSGTIQERILLAWSRENVAHGLKPATLLYFDDAASALLALGSGRADAVLNPHAPLAYEAATQHTIRLVGTVNAGWPERADVAIATRKGGGLAPVLTAATNRLIAGGQYRAALARWGLADEALPRSETNPPGYRDA